MTGARKCTSINGQCIQRIRKLHIVMLSYLPISGNSYEIISTWITFQVCQAHREICSFLRKRMSVPTEIKKKPSVLQLHESLVSPISQFVSILFRSEWILQRKNFTNLLRLNWNIFIHLHNSFLGETSFNTHQKTIAVPRYSHDTVFH